MGIRYIYTVRDYKTGAVIAKGTSLHLEASGVIPKGQKASTWVEHQNKLKHDRQYLIEKEVYGRTRPEAKTRTLNVCTCYDAADNVPAKGTAKGLKKPKVRPKLRKIKDPTPLDYDVHDLMEYNAAARKMGRPELTYGYWAAAGKPGRP